MPTELCHLLRKSSSHKTIPQTILIALAIMPALLYAAPVVVTGPPPVEINGGTASTTADNEPALQSTNSDALITANGANVTTSGNNSPGALASINGVITFNGSTVATSGSNSYGLYATLNGIINASGPFINTTCSSIVPCSGSAGVVADTGGTVNLNGPTIQTSGDTSAGILALPGGIISGPANVTTNNSNSPALSAAGGQITYAGGSINTYGDGSAAFSASASGTLTASGFGEQTTGSNSPAAEAMSGGSVTISNASLQTSGAGSAAVIASGAGSLVNLSSLSAQSTGANAPGLAADSGGLITLSNGSVTTTGSTAPALSLSNGGTISISSGNATAQGSNSAGLSVNNTAGGAASILNLTGASIHSNASDAILIDNAIVTVNANQGNINAGSNGVFVNAINGSSGNIYGDNNSQFSGAINADSGTFYVDNNSQLSGLIHATGSTVNLSLSTNSVWQGTTSTLNNLSIDTTSTWNMTADSTVLGTTTLAGLINFTTPTPTLNTLTFNGPLIGQRGSIELHTTLNSDSDSPTDVIHIVDHSEGTTGIIVDNFNGAGEETINGILVVEGINGGQINFNSFRLANPVVAGPYEYFLFRDGNKLYLRNAASPDVEPPDGGPPDLGPGEGEDEGSIRDGRLTIFQLIPIFRREVSLISALPTLGLLYDRALLGNLHQRLGETLFLDQPSLTHLNRKWIRYVYNDGNLHNGGIYRHGPNFDYVIRIVQLGFDLYRDPRTKTGVFLAGGNSDSNIRADFVRNAGHDQIHGLSLGAYYTYLDTRAWYIDAVLQASRYRFDGTSARNRGSLVTNGNSLTGSLEGGYYLPLLSNTFSIQPQVQFVAQTLHLDNTRLIAANVHFDNTNTFAGRIGLLGEFARFKPVGKFEQVALWLRGNYWHQFSGNPRTRFSSATGYIPFPSPLATNTLEGEAGVTANISIYSVYATFSRAYFNNDHGNATSAILGIKVAA